MASTYEKIATTTLTSAAANITFSSIPATYTDLVAIYTLKGATTVEDVYMRFNGSSATDYSTTYIYGNGTVSGSARFSTVAQIRLNYVNDMLTTDGFMLRCNLNNYSNTTTYKNVLFRGDLASDAVEAGVGLWRSTAAINSIALTLFTNNFAAGCVATLYGIKAA